MGEVLLSSILSGASSSFIECAINAIIKLFNKRTVLGKSEFNKIEIKNFVDNYLNEQYPDLIDSRYINDKLCEFVLEFITYINPPININGDVTFNIIICNQGIENLISDYLKLPGNQKWNEIELLINEKNAARKEVDYSNTINSMRSRANKMNLQLEISDNCSPEKINELKGIIEKYEKIFTEKRSV